MQSRLLLVILCFSLLTITLAQTIYVGPDDPAGDIAFEREAYLNESNVLLYFQNTTEQSDWPAAYVSMWPSDGMGTKMLDGVAFMVSAKVFIQDDNNSATTDTIPLTDWSSVNANDHHTLYFLQTSYREEMDVNIWGDVEWGFYPVQGYMNENQSSPAVSNNPSTWPPNGWPGADNETIWPGEWYGRLGRGVVAADLETYFVVNDAQDQEYLGNEDLVKYYPRPGHYIQDDATIQPGAPWGGLGIRVETRGFQWAHPAMRDAIIWEYNIANVSDYDLLEVAIGYWIDNAIGGSPSGATDGDDELGFFNDAMDLVYSWDIDGIGVGGLPTGTMGFAFLETPGLASDNVDNDDDGLVDEKKDNIPSAIIGPLDGISDLAKFLDYYNLEASDLVSHWDADEDQDWMDGVDANNNGIYEASEFAGDDVGLDGIGPSDINYSGPDAGECDHIPSFEAGVGCEPNFNLTDISESDMIGITSFHLFPVPSHSVSNTTAWFKNDQVMHELLASDTLEEYSGSVNNLIEVVGSGTVPLYSGYQEKASIAEMFAFDDLDGLNSVSHQAPALFELKQVVQDVYENDYRIQFDGQLYSFFEADVIEGVAPLTVHFDNLTNQEENEPIVSWLWDFGDWHTSDDESPSHTYTDYGNFNVTLTAMSQDGQTSSFTRQQYISSRAFTTLTAHGAGVVDVDMDGILEYYSMEGVYSRASSGLQFEFPLDGWLKAVWGDFDKNGFPDVYLMSPGNSTPNHLYTNAGENELMLISAGDISSNTGTYYCNWGDMDNDGHLELLTAQNRYSAGLYKMDSTGLMNIYPVGDDLLSGRWRGCSWIDYNLDLKQDIMLRSSSSTRLLENVDQVSFQLDEHGLPASSFIDFGDIDHDGDLDLLIGEGDSISMYINQDNVEYIPIQIDGFLNFGITWRDAQWIDFNNDSHLDIFLVGTDFNLFLQNLGNNTHQILFEGFDDEMSLPIDYGSWDDFNHDGTLDLITDSGVHESHYSITNNWLNMSLVGSQSNTTGLGAIVRLVCDPGNGEVTQTALMSSNSGNVLNRSAQLHFGLGQASIIDSLIVRWPSGSVQTLSSLSINQRLIIHETGEVVVSADDGNKNYAEPSLFKLEQNYPNPFNPSTTISYSLPEQSRVSLIIYDIKGQIVTEYPKTHQTPGQYNVKWNGRDDNGNNVSTGLYLCRLSTEFDNQTIKMLLLR